MRKSSIRIIGGTHRSRLINFSEEAGVRPTHNRIRETVFNWLTEDIRNSVCLDAFAGSGAMGLEALSRGANHVTFCDISRVAVNNIHANLQNLKITNADVQQCDFMLQNSIKNKFTIVFLDPPFAKNLLLSACQVLVTRELLEKDALVYLEFQKNTVDLTQLPAGWHIKKHKNTQTVEYVLCTVEHL